jgi:hypothetical protein
MTRGLRSPINLRTKSFLGIYHGKKKPIPSPKNVETAFGIWYYLSKN